MPRYTLVKADEVGRTKILLYKLCVDGVCVIDEEENKLESEGSYSHEFPGLYSIMRQACNLMGLSKMKYHPIQLKGIEGNVHEAKTRNLRMYALQLKGSKKVIVLLSKKAMQDKDLRRLTSLVKAIESQGELHIN